LAIRRRQTSRPRPTRADRVAEPFAGPAGQSGLPDSTDLFAATSRYWGLHGQGVEPRCLPSPQGLSSK